MARLVQLQEGIIYIEDLPLEKFMSALDNISKLDASTKIDGAELVFGLDAKGKFYTTRNMKGGKGIHYDTDEYLSGGGGPTFAAAHEALFNVIDDIKKVMLPSEAMEIEVIFGRQPNAIIYGLDGLSYISFLRSVEGTEEIALRKDLPVKLAAALKNEKSTVTSQFPTSTDGITLNTETVTSTWKFTKAAKIDTSKVDPDVAREIQKLRTYLTASNKVAKTAGLDFTNFEVSTLKLTNVPMEIRPAIKDERDQVNVHIMSDFKLPIKEKLLKSLTKGVKSQLQGEVKAGEVDGIEGVVFVDPASNDVFKLVDKDEFAAINVFNYQVRKKLFSVTRTVDPDAALESRGGLVGILKFRVMSLLGIPEAARGFNLKKILGDLDGESPEDTLTKFAGGFSHLNNNAYRQKISAMIKATIEEVNVTLVEFNKNHSSYKLQLKNGKTIGYTDEIVKRTLLMFAEVHKHLEEYKERVDKTRSMKELLSAIIGNVAEKIHNLNEAVKMPTHIRRLEQFKDVDVVRSYVFNYLAAVILCKLKDKVAMHELRDHKGSSLKRIGTSYVNQLGALVFNSDDNLQYVSKSASNKLKKITAKITSVRQNKIHRQISSAQNYRLDFDQVTANLHIMDTRFELHDKLLQLAIKTLKHWNTSSLDDKNHLLSKTFSKLQAIDEDSPYIARLRYAIEHFLINSNKGNKMLIKEIMHLVEDEGGVVAAPSANPDLSSMTQSAAIATLPYRLFKGKVIRRIPRKIEKRKKFAKSKSAIVPTNK